MRKVNAAEDKALMDALKSSGAIVCAPGDMQREIDRLRAELTEARRDCRLCAQFYEGRCLLQARNVPVVCINGDAFVKVLPIRLYAIDAAMAGGEK